MSCQTLQRRRTQLDLLAGACDQQACARVNLRRRVGVGGEARLVRLTRDCVLLNWADGGIAEAEIEGQPLEVRFEHGGERYVFFSTSQGRDQREPGQADARPTLRVSVPLRLELARSREEPRIELDGVPPITGTFTHVVDDRRQFNARLTNIADGGVGAVARAADVCELFTGDLFWLDIKLAGEDQRTEFVVRLAHLRPVRNTDQLMLGWAFQPTDDVGDHDRCLRRLAAFVRRQHSSEGSDEDGRGRR